MLFCIFVFQNLIFNRSNTGILEFYIFKYLHILYFENIGIPYLQKSIYLINAKVSTHSQPLDVSQYQLVAISQLSPGIILMSGVVHDTGILEC